MISTQVCQETYERTNEIKYKCIVCKDTESTQQVEVPYVFKYLLSELALINIRVDAFVWNVYFV